MSGDFEEYAGLSPPERIRLCRHHAREARKLAGLNNATQRGYLKIAEEWERLAAELEQTLRAAAE
jgi:hypothetical protein